MGGAKAVQESVLEGPYLRDGNVPHEGMGAAIEDGNLLPYRHGTVLRLDEQLVVLPTLVQGQFRDLVHIGGELGEGLQFGPLGLVDLKRAGHLLHGLHLGAAAHAGHAEALLQVNLAVCDGNHIGGNIGRYVTSLRLDDGQGGKGAAALYFVLENVRKVYHVGEVDIEALADASFSVRKGELAVVVGESGAGKTTLLNILGGMDTLTSGRVILDGREISGMSLRELTKYRRYDIGFVFQFYNLVQNLTALENVSLATQICSDPLDPEETLKAVGLGDRMNNFPGQLSGGEQQRVAIARALAKNPKLLLCDEPTGALDYNTGKQILQLLQDQARNMGTTVIIITHNKAITPMADRVISVRSGRISDVTVNHDPVPISEIEW